MKRIETQLDDLFGYFKNLKVEKTFSKGKGVDEMLTKIKLVAPAFAKIIQRVRLYVNNEFEEFYTEGEKSGVPFLEHQETIRESGILWKLLDILIQLMIEAEEGAWIVEAKQQLMEALNFELTNVKDCDNIYNLLFKLFLDCLFQNDVNGGLIREARNAFRSLTFVKEYPFINAYLAQLSYKDSIDDHKFEVHDAHLYSFLLSDLAKNRSASNNFLTRLKKEGPEQGTLFFQNLSQLCVNKNNPSFVYQKFIFDRMYGLYEPLFMFHTSLQDYDKVKIIYRKEEDQQHPRIIHDIDEEAYNTQIVG